MKKRDNETQTSLTAKKKSAEPMKMSDHAKEDRSDPRRNTGTPNARNDDSRERAPIVAPTPDTHDSPRKRS